MNELNRHRRVVLLVGATMSAVALAGCERAGSTRKETGDGGDKAGTVLEIIGLGPADAALPVCGPFNATIRQGDVSEEFELPIYGDRDWVRLRGRFRPAEAVVVLFTVTESDADCDLKRFSPGQWYYRGSGDWTGTGDGVLRFHCEHFKKLTATMKRALAP